MSNEVPGVRREMGVYPPSIFSLSVNDVLVGVTGCVFWGAVSDVGNGLTDAYLTKQLWRCFRNGMGDDNILRRFFVRNVRVTARVSDID